MDGDSSYNLVNEGTFDEYLLYLTEHGIDETMGKNNFTEAL